MTHSGSLRKRFFAFIIIVYALTGLLATAAFYLVTERVVRPMARTQLTQRAELERGRIAAIIDREVALATALAHDPSVIRWAQSGKAGPDEVVALQQLESYRTSFRDRTVFVALVADSSYLVHDERRGRRERTFSRADSADRWFFQTLETVDSVALNVDYNVSLGTTKVWVNTIMKDPQGKKVGITGTGIDISDFLREVTKTDASGIRVILVDRKGAITAHENVAYVQHNATVGDDREKMSIYELIGAPEQATALARLISRLDAGENPTDTLELEIEGVRYMGAVRRIDAVHWFDVVLFDMSKLVSPLDFLAPLAVFVVSLVILLLLMGFLLDRIVLSPLARLTEASVAFASGERDIPLSAPRQDEIGVLTSAFKKMTLQIADQTENLERRVASRTAELAQTNAQLEQSQRQIVSSIEVAEMIQASLLPRDHELDAFFEDWFILYRPRDIVGGDFYWFRQLSPHVAAVALVDCVGHGVPGAFMTMMVKTILDQTVGGGVDQDPGEVLGEINRRLRETLRQDDAAPGSMESGAEIGLCICDTVARSVRFAGAGISLEVTEGATARRIAGDRQPVGYRRSHAEHRYETHEAADAGQRYYMTTDGILDQPGGRSGYGWGRQRFHDTLQAIGKMPLRDQKEHIANAVGEYQGARAQVDDIAIIGFTLGSGETSC